MLAGRDKLAFNKNRVESDSLNMYCKSCSTILMIDHPFYQQKQVLNFGMEGQQTGFTTWVDASYDKELIRFWIKDWPAEAIAKLPELPGAYAEADGSFNGTGDWAAAFGKVGEIVGGEIEKIEGGTNMQELFHEAGGKAALTIIGANQDRSFNANGGTGMIFADKVYY